MGSTRGSWVPTMLTASSLPLMNSSNITLRSKESADTMARGRSLASPTTLIPSADPCAAGLTTSGSTESVEAGSGQTSAGQGVRGEKLIHSPDAGRHPRPCVGYPQYLQQLLDSAVFTPLAVHGDEADVRVQVHQSANQRLIHINGRYLVASSFQGPRNPGSSVD